MAPVQRGLELLIIGEKLYPGLTRCHLVAHGVTPPAHAPQQEVSFYEQYIRASFQASQWQNCKTQRKFSHVSRFPFLEFSPMTNRCNGKRAKVGVRPALRYTECILCIISCRIQNKSPNFPGSQVHPHKLGEHALPYKALWGISVMKCTWHSTYRRCT